MTTNGRGVAALAILAGAALGVFSMLADGIIGGRLFVILGNLAAPWVLTAFLVGLRARSRREGALVGALTLLVGVVTYYFGAFLRGYVVGVTTVAWTIVAAVAGPIMGLSGAAVTTRRPRPPVIAVASPSVMLVSEAIFFVVDRRMWLYDLRAEPYRVVDVCVVAMLLGTALLLPPLLVKGIRERASAYALIAVAGVCGSFALTVLWRLIAGS